MIAAGLLLILLAVVAGTLLYLGVAQITDRVTIDLLGGQISLNPLALVVVGAVVVTVFWLGWVLLRTGAKRATARRRAVKEQQRAGAAADRAAAERAATDRASTDRASTDRAAADGSARARASGDGTAGPDLSR